MLTQCVRARGSHDELDHQARSIIQIYTDWANHYLERARSRRRVTDLGADCRDGVLLADLLEAVGGMKVPHVARKPRNQAQMFDNVSACLTLLHSQSVAGLEHVTAGDICAGRLKSVLALFFALSRYKQTTKQQQLQLQQQNQKVANSAAVKQTPAVPTPEMTPNRQLPSPYCKTTSGSGGVMGGSSAIPLPGSALPARRCPPDKVRPLPPTPGGHPGIPGVARQAGAPSESSSRSESPQGGNGSLIPRIPHSSSRPSSIASIPGSKIPSTNGSYATGQIPNGQIPNGNAGGNTNGKYSMLDKLKLFNKDKTPERSKTQISKRTSSSSGFSSARSERSDSSLSLNDSVNGTTGLRVPGSMQTKQKSGLDTLNKDNKSGKTKNATVKNDKNEKNIAKPAVKIEKTQNKVEKTKKCEENKIVSKANGPTKVAQPLSPSVDDGKSKIPNSKLVDTRLKSNSQLRLSVERPLSEHRTLQPPKIMVNQPNTGIPKPMAAIKGTAKPKEDKMKDEKLKDTSPVKNNPEDESPVKPQKQTLIVSPMPVAKEIFSGSMTDSLNSGSNHSAQNSNSSESSVIYRPSSESGASDAFVNRNSGDPNHHKQVIPNRKIERADYMPDVIAEAEYEMNEVNELKNQINAHDQMLKPLSETKVRHQRSVQNQDLEDCDNNSLGHNSENTVLPMRPLLRGYAPGQSQGRRNPHGQSSQDHCNGGYLSDGDMLRSSNGNGHSDGYMSEGGATLYGRRVNYDHRSGQVSGAVRMEGPGGGAPLVYRVVGGSKGRPKAEPESAQRRAQGGSHNGAISAGSNSDQWRKYTDVGSLPQTPPSPTGGRKSGRSNNGPGSPGQGRRSSNGQTGPQHQQHQQHQQQQQQHNNRQQQNNGSSRVKGVPQSFGYVKRGGSSSHQGAQPAGNGSQMQPGQGQGRTAQVSAVPRSRLKVSGGTQTCTADLQSKPGQGNLMQQQQQGANVNKSYSLTGASASQLSQSVRERLALGSQSLPKPGSPEFQHLFQAHRIANRGMKITDGSLSDTQAYAEVKSEYGSPYASWLKHSNTYGAGGVRLSECDSLESLSQHRTSIGSSGGVPMVGHSPSLMGLGGHMTANRASSQHRDAHSPRLNRSNSIRSTKSEKLYPSTLSRVPDPSDCEPYYCLPVGSQHHGHNLGQHHTTHHSTLGPWASQPTSPTPQNRSGPGGGPLMMGPLSPTIARGYTKKNDDAHGSAASLLSAGSSLYGGLGGNGTGNQAAEERRASEVRRLKRELIDARDQVLSLTSQLSTNAHVVSAFEQSLQNMTQRLQQLTVTAERKDSEVTEMRQTIELLRKQSVQAGLTSAHMISMGVPQNGVTPPTAGNPALTTQGNVTCTSRPNMTRHLSTDSMSSLNSLSSSCSAQDKKKKKGWLRSSFTKAFSRNAKISKTSRHPSSDCTTDGPADPGGSHLSDSPRSPSRSPAKSNQPQASSTPNSGNNGKNGNINGHQLQHQQVQTTPEQESARRTEDPQLEELRKQLREKDLVLTDIRLEALTSAHQLESLKDTVIKMRTEMMNLKQNNERLQRLVTSRSLAGSEVSLGGSVASSSDPRRCSAADGLALRPSMELPHYLSETDEDSAGLMPCDPPEPAESPPMNGSGAVQDPDRDQSDQSSSSPDQSSGTSPEREHIRSGTTTTDAGGEMEGKRIAICVYLGQPDSFLRYLDEIGALNHGGHEHYITAENNHESDFYKNHQQSYQQSSSADEFTIAYTRISGKTTWQNLDDVVRKTFRDYLSKVDPGSNLGLNTDSITSYHLGEAKRGPDTGLPELLPCGYIVGRVRALYICLQGVGGLAFDSLIPRSIVNRYVSLLSEHHRLILCGPRGTGKSYLARRLAEFLVARSGHANPNEAIATFHVDHKSGSAGELRQYLCHVAEIAASSAISTDGGSLPEVIILDDLHNAGAGALADAFGGLLSVSSGNAGSGENGRGALPRIIGTMSQATCNTTNLQLHHNFRWVLTANHMEPVKGFLARYLRRHVFSLELRTGVVQSELSRVLQWLPAVWSHVNRFLEAHSSSDVTLGPGLFLQCPLDVKRSQVWFTNIWNYKLAPFIVEAVREGVALYGRRGGAWQDPSVFLRETYPWATTLPGSGAGNTCGVGPAALRRVTADDVGLANEAALNSELGDAENGGHTNGEIQDPLSNMLMRLQEAANYSGNQSNDSDSASVDSNMTHDSSAGVD